MLTGTAFGNAYQKSLNMSKELGISVKNATGEKVSLVRRTLESEICVSLEEGERRPCNIQTGKNFFDHMLESIASRACLNMDLSCEGERLFDHVIAEDVGLTLGRGVRELLEAKRTQGVNERGFYQVAFDEALVAVTLAFDGRGSTFFHGDVEGTKRERVEDMASEDLLEFFKGFSLGAGCATHIQWTSGENSHHTWEATFKAFGEALRESLSPCPYRAGTTIGLKGTGMESR